MAQNQSRSRLGLGLQKQRERKRGKRIERERREKEVEDQRRCRWRLTGVRLHRDGRRGEGKWLGLRWARRLRCGGGRRGMKWLARVTVGKRGPRRLYTPGRCTGPSRAGHLYRAVPVLAPWAGLAAQARHGPRAGPAWACLLTGRAVLGPCCAVPGHGPPGGPARFGHV